MKNQYTTSICSLVYLKVDWLKKFVSKMNQLKLFSLQYNYSNLINMNEFISPHQNININISYNLGQQQKMPKVVFGKKIAKIVKSAAKDNTDLLYKTFKKNSQHLIQPQQIKKGSQTKNKLKKKKQNNLSTLPDQDIAQPRRLKTQGNIKHEAINTIIKKQQKSNCKTTFKGNSQHSKSVTNPPVSQNTKILQIKKSVTNPNKLKKQQRRANNKSCILYQPKRNLLLSDIQHVVSTTTNGPTPTNKHPNKKRVNSVNVMRSDKFINKLLDMSVLTSELGGSFPLYDENSRNHQNTNNRIKNSLQQFMNSVDLRIIKKMQQDQKKKNILIDTNIGQGMQLISYLNKIRRISIQKLNEKATKIQRFWRKKTTQNIIPYYSNMFFRNPTINSKVAMQNNLNEISNIDVKLGEGEQEEEQQQDSLMKKSSKRNHVERQIFQFVSAARVSSSQKPNFQQQSISAAKIQRMLQFGSAKQPNFIEFQQHQFQEYQKVQQFQENQLDENDQQQVFDLEEQNLQQENEIQQNPKEEQFVYEEKKPEDQIQKDGQGKSLNIQKYKQLVRESIQKNKKQAQKQKYFQNLRHPQISKQLTNKSSDASSNEERKYVATTNQAAHWNHVHDILSSNMNKKAPQLSKTVLQQLMKQSIYNKQWVQGQFSNSQSRKISQKSSPRQIRQQIMSKQVCQHQDRGIKEEQAQLQIKNKQRSRNKIQKMLACQLEQLSKQQYKFVSKSSRQAGAHSQEEDNYKEQYNWNKYSDISRLKKPQQLKHNPTNNKANTKQNHTQNGVRQHLKLVNQYNQIVPGLLPSGIKHAGLYSQQESEQQQKKGEQVNKQVKPNTKKSKIDNIDSIDDYINGEKDEKWIRQQMIMQDGIVQKYLDCGLDNFVLHINGNNSHTNNDHNINQKIHNNSIEPMFYRKQGEQLYEEEPEQHMAKLQKQPQRHQNDDIFSGDQDKFNTDTHDDQELVFVFNNAHKNANKQKNDLKYNDTQKDQRDIALEHAVKNSKRKDNAYHLGYRPQDLSVINQFVNADYSISKLRQQKQQQVKNSRNIQHTHKKQLKVEQQRKKDHNQQSIKNQTKQIQLFQPSFKSSYSQNNNSYSEELEIAQQINTKRVQSVTQTIIAKLIQQFAIDVSVILRKTQTIMAQAGTGQNQRTLNNNINSQLRPTSGPNSQSSSLNASSNIMGIQTNFQNIREFITKLKQYVISSQQYSKKVIQNLKNNIGPTSMQILSYLRIEEQQFNPDSTVGQSFQPQAQLQQEQQDNEQWLFVIPNQLFQQFNKKLLDQQQERKNKKLTNRYKLYTQFWHRSIFQCFNECLDFERPYGITGAPYAWITQPKLPHKISFSKKKVEQILQSAQNRLLQLSFSASGIIFDKPESPYRQIDLDEQQKSQLNQQKISRMLANQILDDEYNWITYNDQMTELMVDISRKIEELLLFQLSTDLKKIMRRRKMMVHVNRDGGQSSGDEQQHVVFMVEDLV